MKKYLLLLATLFVSLTACEQNPIVEYSIYLSDTELTFGAEGGEQTITMKAEGGREQETWYVSLPEWCEGPRGGYAGEHEITIRVSPYLESTARQCTLTFSFGDKTAELVVTQEVDDSPIIQFTDPLFLNALLDIDDVTIDVNGDGQISELEASVVTGFGRHESVIFRGHGIRNMDEIKYFTALPTLGCANNKLTALDVSRNIKLEYLDCAQNNLTSLDVSKNTELTHLECDNNNMTSLDVSNNVKLEYLNCADHTYENATEYNHNNITTIDLSKNTALKTLICESELTSIDLSTCTLLEYCSISRNNLTTLDLSKNTALEDLDCSGNELTELDLSKNTALKSLNCRNNQLTELDLRNQKKLTRLFCYGNPLTTIYLPKYHILDGSSMEELEKMSGLEIIYVE